MTFTAMGRRMASFGVPLLVWLAIWAILPYLNLIDPSFLPTPAAVTAALMKLGLRAAFYQDLGVTLFRSLAGLALGILFGVPLGAWMAVSRHAEGFFNPIIRSTYSLPKTALVPLLMLWFGIGNITSILAVMLSTVLPMVIYTYHAVQDTPRILLWSARGMGTPNRHLMWLVRLPMSLHGILTGARIALGFSFVIAVAAEMIAAKLGIGKLIFMFGENGAYDYMFAAVMAIVVAACASDALLVALTNYLLRWQDTTRHSSR
jgi:ABC-type nitrate/sulfonate/bicarbonate transport system permease component